jgi:signal transduction histidine kinase
MKTKAQRHPAPPQSAKRAGKNNTVPANGGANPVVQPVTTPNANGAAQSNNGQSAQANNGSPNRPETQNSQPEPMLQLFDLKGHSIAWWSKAPPMDMRSYLLSVHGKLVLSTRKVNGFESRILSRPFPDNPPYFGVMQVSYPLTEVNHALEGLDRALLTLIPAAILLASLGGMLLTDRALRPVRRLRVSADRISAENFAQRLPVIGQDEFAELARTFNSMLGRLEMAFREQENLVAQLRRFTGDASHELRTPLTIIKANTSLCLSGDPTETDSRQSMEDIDRAADSMSKLVNDLLLLARSDSGQLGVNRIAIPLREAIERAIANVSRKNTATIRKRLPKDGTVVYASEDEIIRLFTNILDNALQHTPPTGSVQITSQRIDGNVMVAIKDTGCGIDATHLSHLGERFYRIDSARSRPEGGTGLGLSICKSIVDAHGGSISFESEVNVGTTVTITLPVYEDNIITD